jgi:hypothetical protein
MELEFWRSIKDSDDANDFELYVRQFPQGVYASLAARKAGKLRGGSPADDSGTRTMAGEDRTRLQRSVPRAEAGRSEPADKTLGLADAAPPAPTRHKKSLLVPGILGVLLLSGAAAYFFVVKPSQDSAAQKVEAEAKAGRDAAEAAKAEAQAKREAQAQAQRDNQAKRDAETQAKQAAEAQAQRAAELKSKREADAKAQRAADAQAKREAEAQAKREAEAQAKRETESKAQRDAELKTKREAEAKAQREGKEKAQRDAENKAKLAAESSLWNSIKSSRNAADFQKYLERYPNGQYVDPARQRVLALEEQKLKEQQQRAQEAEARKQKDAERKKSRVIAPPTF